MTLYWTITDYAIQWLFVIIIICCALVFATRIIYMLFCRKATTPGDKCNGCILSRNCHRKTKNKL